MHIFIILTLWTLRAEPSKPLSLLLLLHSFQLLVWITIRGQFVVHKRMAGNYGAKSSQLTRRIHCDLIWFESSLEMGKCSITSDQFSFFLCYSLSQHTFPFWFWFFEVYAFIVDLLTHFTVFWFIEKHLLKTVHSYKFSYLSYSFSR